MSSLATKWHQFQKWLKNFLQTSSTIDSITVEHDEPQEESPLQNLRDSRHTIRVNLAILEKEITELNAIARKAIPSAPVSEAKKLLAKAQGALLLEMGLFALSAATPEELGDILGQVFVAMNQSNQARHLLNACARA